MAKYGGGGFHFQQDGATSHTSHERMKVLRKMFGPDRILQNPPNSPDLSPLDYYAWDAVDQKVQSLGPKNLPELKKCIVQAWGELNLDHLKKACTTGWVKRLKACVINEGGRFEYAL